MDGGGGMVAEEIKYKATTTTIPLVRYTRECESLRYRGNFYVSSSASSIPSSLPLLPALCLESAGRLNRG